MRAMRAMRLLAMGALLGAGACSAELPIEGQWSGRDADGSYIGYTFDADGRAFEVRGDSVREFRYRLDGGYDPPRLELRGAGSARQGVVRFVNADEMRVLLVPASAQAPQAFSPATPGVVLTRREMR